MELGLLCATPGQEEVFSLYVCFPHCFYLFFFLNSKLHLKNQVAEVFLKIQSILCLCGKQVANKAKRAALCDSVVSHPSASSASDKSSFAAIQNLKDGCGCSFAAPDLGMFLRGNQTIPLVSKTCDLPSPTHTPQSQHRV